MDSEKDALKRPDEEMNRDNVKPEALLASPVPAHPNETDKGQQWPSEPPKHEKEDVYSVFTPGQKNFIVLMSGLGGFFSPLSANTYLPAIPMLSKDLNVSWTLINLTITAFMIFQGLAPSVYGDLADMMGRRPAYLIAFIVYIAANIGLGLQTSYPALFILRCLQSAGSGGLYSLNSGVVADISTTAERGKYMGMAQSGIMLGPAIGPIIGGLLAQYQGWRAIFWFLVIFGGVYIIVLGMAFPETARKVVGNGSLPPTAWWSRSLVGEWVRRRQEIANPSLRDERKSASRNLAQKRILRWPNPLKTLLIIVEKDVSVILFYNAIIYASWYTVTASLATQFTVVYGLDTLQVGLCYVPFGLGAAVSIFVNGKLLDWNYRRVALANGCTVDKKKGDDLAKFPIEHARLAIVWPLVYVGGIVMIGYGWTIEKHTHIAAPLVLTFVMALTMTACYNSMNILLVDLYPQSPSTASAANNLTRCLMGAGGSAMINPMINGIGSGWSYTVVGLVVILLSPMLYVVTQWGPKWREERRIRFAEKKRHQEANKSKV
ncbi:uncharacterized protein TRUGW13939_00015 [Talaromyces rugulosus]|uniref:Major facilitator superfamily (MFS) profile domain-containing protein n=1 Tax=Talaromyces rugulosus TaxID=121627 RepID=A0A7H8QG46_TALRU|nr:uncharacterized protein TRUGW13939_00015 [Talaromyces rugulosus]QKX52944.1 hypothetical protein TRUGW13939_00015 [Talaromyces rugulosus]